MSKKRLERQVIVVSGQESVQPNQPVVPVKIELTFDAWWAMRQGTLRLPSDMKDILRKHFTARGFMASKEFDKGLADFGLKA